MLTSDEKNFHEFLLDTAKRGAKAKDISWAVLWSKIMDAVVDTYKLEKSKLGGLK